MLGKGKGANIAAWKQAARAELATSTVHPVGYCQALLDLIKAFDNVPDVVATPFHGGVLDEEADSGRYHRVQGVVATVWHHCWLRLCVCRDEGGND